MLISRVWASTSWAAPLIDLTRASRLLGTRLLSRLSDGFMILLPVRADVNVRIYRNQAENDPGSYFGFHAVPERESADLGDRVILRFGEFRCRGGLKSPTYQFSKPP